MTSMVRRLALVSAVFAAAFAFAPTAPAAAYPQCLANTMCGWLYYSDAARTHQQGGHTTNCDGVVLDWGIKQGYSKYIVQTCGGEPDPV
jgi:hypothetical protein